MPAWIPVLIVAIAIGVYVVARIFSGKSKRDYVAEAKAETADIKAAADAALAAELQEVDAARGELDRIKDIDGDEARLAELAKYANRRRR